MKNNPPQKNYLTDLIQPIIAQKIRSRLNVQRERFRMQEDGQDTWAGGRSRK